ncbi:MAG: manganese-binding transcriptional regulator MntR [Pirellula sp.]
MASALAKTRRDHATETAEDYVEAIAEIIESEGVCRCVNLVNRFSVTNATVNNTVARLVRDGLVETQPYRPLLLTAKGKRLASECMKRHKLVEAFLLAMGISPEIAAEDSEGIEHHVSKETLSAMQRILSKGWPK